MSTVKVLSHEVFESGLGFSLQAAVHSLLIKNFLCDVYIINFHICPTAWYTASKTSSCSADDLLIYKYSFGDIISAFVCF